VFSEDGYRDSPETEENIITTHQQTSSFRGIGVFAHVDAGKTTITEQLLALAGAISSPGSVDRGTAKTDDLEVERRRGISVRSASVYFEWQGEGIYLVDTPGHQDFAAEVERMFPVLDGALLILSAVEGVQAHTRALWKALREYHIPTLLYVNKMDRAGADFSGVVRDARRILHPRIVPLQTFGNLDENTEGAPSYLWNRTLENPEYGMMMEVLAEMDEEAFEAFVEERRLSSEKIRRILREEALRGNLYPLLGGSALKGAGMEELLNALCTYLPSFSGNPDKPLCAKVCSILHHPSLGRGALLRVASGTLVNREELYNTTRKVREKVSMLRGVGVGKYREIQSLRAGEMGLVFGMNQVQAGDLLGEPSFFRKSEKVAFVEPLYAVTVEPGIEEEYPALLQALRILEEEDPHLRLRIHPESREIQIHILGPMQIEILQDFLLQRFALVPRFRPPQTIYRETPRTSAEGYVEYTLPKPCWAVMRFLIEPLPRGEGVRFASQVSTDKIAAKYQREVERTIPKALEQGLLGWEVTDLAITLVDGEDHEIHSRPSDFVLATPMGIMDALNRSGTLLLEPLLAFDITVPEEFGSRILGDLVQMRGEFETPRIGEGLFEVSGLVPAEASMEYHVRLGTLSGGTGRMITRFGGYRECPPERNVSRPRVGVNPLDTAKYILAARGALGSSRE
jgi:ribosomal protection tetracycline resistance protein